LIKILTDFKITKFNLVLSHILTRRVYIHKCFCRLTLKTKLLYTYWD